MLFFLPVYRKLNIYTLSDYLSRRYDDRSRVAYALIMITIIVVVMMVPAFYIGSKALNILLVDQVQVQQALESAAAGQPTGIQIEQSTYVLGILIMAIVAGSYTILGGLKAVIITDVIQSVFMLVGAAIVAWLTFGQAEIGGWDGMRALDAKGKDLMHLYLPMNHPARPWTGMLSGLLILHFYYWSANQFIVQRALAARSDREARLGIVTAGFFKLLIPFMSIGTGVAAFYYFQATMPGVPVDGDTAFPLLMREVVAPVGFGLAGLVAAGLIGAILSSVDSMLNSAATLITFDIYKRFINPQANEKQLIRIGRFCIAGFVIGSALLAIFIFDPNSKEPFFTYVARHQSRLIAGNGSGLWAWDAVERCHRCRRVCGHLDRGGGFLRPVTPLCQNARAVRNGGRLAGDRAQFLSCGVCCCHLCDHRAHPRQQRPNPILPRPSSPGTGWDSISKERLTAYARRLVMTVVVFAIWAHAWQRGRPEALGSCHARCGWTLGILLFAIGKAPRPKGEKGLDDRLLASLLASCAVFVLFYFY